MSRPDTPLISTSQTRRIAAPAVPFWTILAVAVLLLSGWSLLRLARFAGEAVDLPLPLDGQEGMALWEASLLRSGEGLYLPVIPEYFVSAPYPPIHPLLLALVGHLSGPASFMAGRLVSVAAALGVAVCGFGLVRRVTRSWIGGLAAALLLLSFAPIQIWALRVKPDMLGLCWTLAGLWLVASSMRDEPGAALAIKPRLPVVGLPFSLLGAASAFVLAHFTKQTMLAGPLAAATLLFLFDRRLALRWFALYILLLLTIWGLLDLVTHGQYTYHVWVLHKLPWSGYRFSKFALQLRDTWPLIVLGLAGIVACWRRPTVLNAYLLWAPASLIGSGVLGSNHNHLLETGAALALVGGQAVGLGLLRGGALRVLAPALVAVQLLIWRAPQEWFAHDYRIGTGPMRYVEFIRATPGEIMADDVGLLYAAGRPLRYDDPAAMGPASQLGLWDDSQFLADIRAGHFSAILFPFDVEDDKLDNAGRWTPEMIQAIRDGYTLKFEDSLNVYVPKAAMPAP